MVQILPSKPDPLNQILKGLSTAVPDALAKYEQRQKEQSERDLLTQRGKAASEFLGMDVSGLSPKSQEELIGERAKSLEQQRALGTFMGREQQPFVGQPTPRPPEGAPIEGGLIPGSPRYQDFLDQYQNMEPLQRAGFDQAFPKLHNLLSNK